MHSASHSVFLHGLGGHSLGPSQYRVRRQLLRPDNDIKPHRATNFSKRGLNTPTAYRLVVVAHGQGKDRTFQPVWAESCRWWRSDRSYICIIIRVSRDTRASKPYSTRRDGRCASRCSVGSAGPTRKCGELGGHLDQVVLVVYSSRLQELLV